MSICTLFISGALAWEPKAATAAVMGGAVSAVAAVVLFGLGQWVERSKAKRATKARQVEGAIATIFRLRAWLDEGLKARSHVVESIGDSAEVTAPIFPRVFPRFESGHSPEDLRIEDLSFLVSLDQVILLQDLIEMQEWAKSLLAATREFSRQRTDWNKWAPANSVSVRQDDGAVVSQFSGAAHIEATIAAKKMDALLQHVIDVSNGYDSYCKALTRFMQVCKLHFGKDFPQNWDLDLRGGVVAG